jgi:hypothetical protein
MMEVNMKWFLVAALLLYAVAPAHALLLFAPCAKLSPEWILTDIRQALKIPRDTGLRLSIADEYLKRG